MKHRFVFFVVLAFAACACGKVDLVTLPARDAVQLTIYNSADLTLARERRALTLAEGANTLQFSWAHTLIDPTSLEMLPKAHAAKIDIAELVFPAGVRYGVVPDPVAEVERGEPILSRVPLIGRAFKIRNNQPLPGVMNLGQWSITSEISGRVPVEISYLTSGLSWRAFYMGTLAPDEKTMRLQAYVRVTNNSGEDYGNAQVRLIVGKIHLLDQIAKLANRPYPYGSPIRRPRSSHVSYALPPQQAKEEFERVQDIYIGGRFTVANAKQIIKEELSEYFLYTIEGTETIPNGYSKRLLSFEVDDVPVVNLYKFEEERYGGDVVQFLSFANDVDHELGETPIPGGVLKAYRRVDDRRHLSYVGESEFKYIPVGEDVELDFGPVRDVVVEPTLMNFATDNYRFDRRGNIAGWDEQRTFEVKVRNTRDVPIEVEVRRNFETSYWTLTKGGDIDAFETVDVDTVKFTLTLPVRSQRSFEYTLTTYEGTRREAWKRLAR